VRKVRRKAAAAGPPGHIAERLRRLREIMHRRNLSAFLVTDPVDQFYLTGFDGEDGAALISAKRVYLMTDSRFDEVADRHAPWASKIVRRGGLTEAVGKLLNRRRVRRVGIQSSHISMHDAAELRRVVGATRLVAMPGVADELRLCKDATELVTIRRAIDIAQKAFIATNRRIRIGLSERRIAADLEHEMRRLGADAASFPTIVAIGPNGSLPHARPGDRRVERGSAILIDWGARVGGYCSDLTRVVFVARIPPRLGKVYQVVLDAQLRAIQAIRPQVRADRVDAVARRRITRAGYGKRFGHGLGHGLGLKVHEQPRVSRLSKAELQVGMVFTVEPGVYLPGVGGVRIEDDVLVTPEGVEVLSTLGKDLQDMVL